MTNTYDTSNEPLGSTAVKVLYNNASNLDDALNAFVRTWIDRFGRTRTTWYGFEQAFNDFLVSSGFEAIHLVYVDGTPLQVDRATQLIDRDGSIYRVKMPAEFPVNLTGSWVTDAPLLVDVGDASLRQELAAPGGGALVHGAGRDNEFAFGNIVDHESDFATLGASLGPDMATIVRTNFDSAGVHGAGTIGTMVGPVPGPDLFGHYCVELRILTTARGNVNVLLDGVSVWPDHPAGYPFTNGGVTISGSENNRDTDPELYRFVYFTSGNSFSSLTLQTDATWAGQVYHIKVYPVDPTKFVVGGAGTGNGPHDPIGLKVGAYQRNDMALGDRYTLGMFSYDGQPKTPAHNVAQGCKALATNIDGDQNTATGTYALMHNEVSNNDAHGYSALKMNTKGRENHAAGYKALTSNAIGSRLAANGFWALGQHTDGDHCAAHGWYAGRNQLFGSSNCYYGPATGMANPGGSGNTYLGAFAHYGNGNPGAIYNNLTCGGSESWAYGDGATAYGVQARVGTSASPSPEGLAVGHGASATGDYGPVALGFGTVASGSRSLAAGEEAQATGLQSVALGPLAKAVGQYSISLGSQAGANNTGNTNVFLGAFAGGGASAYSNISCLGYSSVVTGDNQLQLGNTNAVPYAFAAVQIRSDARDKTDVSDTELGIEFITRLRPVQGRWDIREDYTERNEDGSVTTHPKDGSRKRKRFHQWFIAQEVAELCEALAVDFAGLQHHAVNGGEDVYSLGYEEFIPPTVRAVQQCWERLNDLEERIRSLENK
jgi:hypothetical protein